MLKSPTDTGQKQSFGDVLQNKCSQNFSKFYRKTPLLEPLLDKVADLQAATLLKSDSSTGIFQ